jgi:glycosyltransferase involved in cell wall biosynthesis
VDVSEKLRPIKLPPLGAEPLVSILVANYNYGRYIGQALDSVLQQTYPNFEIIVCDDGSTDDSREIVARYCSRDARIRLVAQENGGMVSALNAAYRPSQGEIICQLDADDLFLPRKLERVVEAFRQSPQSGMCFHRIVKMRNDGKTFSYPRPLFLYKGWVAVEAVCNGGLVRGGPWASGLSFRRGVTELFFPLPPRLCHLRGFQDAYLSNGAQFFTEVCSLREPLAKLRIHSANDASSAGFTIPRVTGSLDGWETLIGLWRNLLERHYGRAVAGRLRLEDGFPYQCFRVILRVLGGERQKDRQILPIEGVVNHIHAWRGRLVSRVMLNLPSWLSRRALELWRGESASQAALVRTARSFLRF